MIRVKFGLKMIVVSLQKIFQLFPTGSYAILSHHMILTISSYDINYLCTSLLKLDPICHYLTSPNRLNVGDLDSEKGVLASHLLLLKLCLMT